MDPIMTPQEVAAYIGVPLATLYAWNSRGTSPRRFHAGKHVRYRRSDVEQWIDSQYERDGTPAA